MKKGFLKVLYTKPAWFLTHQDDSNYSVFSPFLFSTIIYYRYDIYRLRNDCNLFFCFKSKKNMQPLSGGCISCNLFLTNQHKINWTIMRFVHIYFMIKINWSQYIWSILLIEFEIFLQLNTVTSIFETLPIRLCE